MKDGKTNQQYVSLLVALRMLLPLPARTTISEDVALDGFSAFYVVCSVKGNTATVQNNFGKDGKYFYGWYVYEMYCTSPVLKIKTTGERSFTFQIPDPDKLYRVKAFVSDQKGNKVSAYVGYVFDERYLTDYEVKLKSFSCSGEDLHKLCGYGTTFYNIITVDTILSGQLYGADTSLPFDWDLNGLARTEAGMIYSFRAFDNLFNDWIKTGRTIDKETEMAYILSWIRHFSDVPEEADGGAWHADSTARRVARFSTALLIWGDDMNKESRFAIENSLRGQAALLASFSFYKEKHNHGFYQDLGLALYSVAMRGKDPNVAYYLRLALLRNRYYVDYSIAGDGTHMEHSPEYAKASFNLCTNMSQIYKPIDADYASELVEKVSVMKEWFIQFVMPDGTFPSIGDSNRMFYPVYCLEDDPEYQWVKTMGTKGLAPEKAFAVFPEGGYGIMRSSWKDWTDEAAWMILTAATHSETHKHNDDLNVLLYHKGDLITEGGNRNYNYDEPGTQYVYSSYAHNVLFVGGKAWPVKDLSYGPVIDDDALATHIMEWSEKNGVQQVSAEAIRWKTVTQDRTLSYNRVGDTVNIRDVLYASRQESARLIWHIAVGVEVEQTEDGWVCSRDGEIVAIMTVDATMDVCLATLTGEQTDGAFSTAIYGGNSNPQYGSLLIIDFTCPKGESSIALNIALR